ncbi:hypothetical protein [Quadrisphaera sp. KR29]|uniref:hypothetical protein n=1 Tax=Quadrisphaera sp. KR29 TaxID=3461391 RepID=UPI0040439A71
MLLLRWYLAVAALAAVAYYAAPEGLVRDAVYAVCGLLGVVGIAWGVLRHRPQERAAWWLLAAGQLLFTAADTVFAYYDHVLHTSPFPSAADVLYLLAYPVLALSLWRLVRLAPSGLDRAGLLDSAVLTVALTLVSWVALAHPLLASDEPLVSRLVSAAYPLADILLLALLVLLVMAPGARTASFRLLCASTVLLLVADTLYAALTATGDFTDGDVTSGAWIASYALAGAAALHPSVRELSSRSARGADGAIAAGGTGSPLTRRRLALLAGAVALAPLTMAVEHLLGLPLDVWALVLSSLVLFGLVVARLATVVRQVERSSRQRDALRGDLAHAAAHDR